MAIDGTTSAETGTDRKVDMTPYYEASRGLLDSLAVLVHEGGLDVEGARQILIEHDPAFGKHIQQILPIIDIESSVTAEA